MKVLKAPHGLFDVFIGEGWTNHSRVRLVKTGTGRRLIAHSGIRLPRTVMLNLEKRIS